MNRIVRTAMLVTVVFTILNSARAQWVQTSGPFSENVTALAVIGEKTFAGTSYNGIYVSTNSGLSWTHLDNGLAGVEATCFATIGSASFVGTNGAGVFRSTDGGLSGIAVDSGLTDASIAALAVSGTKLFANTFDGLFVSTNSGDFWTRVGQLDALGNLTGGPLLVKQNNGAPSTIYVGDYTGLFCSTDDGTNWTKLNNPPTNASNPYITALALVTSDPATKYLFAGTWGEGVFRTSNDGAGWTECSTGLVQTWSDFVFVNTLVSDGSDLYVGENIQGDFECGVFESTDFGSSWVSRNTELKDRDVNALAVKESVLFAGTSQGGVFRTTNSGTNWNQANVGMNYEYVNALVNRGGKIYAGAGNGGVFLSSDRGANWSQINNNSEIDLFTYSELWAITALTLTNNHCIFAATEQGGYRSTDDGTTWSCIDNIKKADGWYSTNLPSCTWSLLSLPRGPDSSYVFDGSLNEGVALSTDNGDYWSSVNTGLWSDPRNYIVYSLIAVAGNTGDTVLYAGMGTQSSTSYGSVYYSTNKGQSWTALGNGLPACDVWALAYKSPYLFAGTNGEGIYRLQDGSASWVAASTQPSNTVVSSFSVTGNTIFAGTYGGGVYRSSDNGASWFEINESLGSRISGTASANPKPLMKLVGESVRAGTTKPTAIHGRWASPSSLESTGGVTDGVSVNALAVDSVNLYAGTLGQGVWKRALSEILTAVPVRDSKPDRFSLAQNYPNPFNPVTVISYQLPVVSKVRLVIYDIQGREVQTLVNEMKQPGRYEVKFNGSDLASGVYFYRIQAGVFVQTRKLLLVR